MRKLFFAGWLMLLLLPVLALAQSPFDGTWKLDMSSVQWPEKPEVYLLQNGTYECKTCVPPINIKADGADQNVTGDPYSDTLAVKVIDDHNIETTSKKGGKVVGTGKESVSSDGDTLTVHWTNSAYAAAGTLSGSYTARRVEKGPAGANLISGSWRAQKSEPPAAFTTWTFKLSGNEVTMSSPIGASYTARLNGTDAPFKGSPGVTSVSVKMLAKDTLEETRKRDGKVIRVATATASADGKTLKIAYENKLTGTTTKIDALKQ
jgi:hypothetical protein